MMGNRSNLFLHIVASYYQNVRSLHLMKMIETKNIENRVTRGNNYIE